VSSIWEILDIKKTKIESKIKKAYAQKLKQIDREKNSEEFSKLRKAYEEAIEYSKKKVNRKKKSIDSLNSETLQSSNSEVLYSTDLPSPKEVNIYEQFIFSLDTVSDEELLSKWTELEKELVEKVIDENEAINEKLKSYLDTNFYTSFRNPDQFPILTLEKISKYFDWENSQSNLFRELKARIEARKMKNKLKEEAKLEPLYEYLLKPSYYYEETEIKVNLLSKQTIHYKIDAILKTAPEYFDYELDRSDIEFWKNITPIYIEPTGILKLKKFLYILSGFCFLGFLADLFFPSNDSHSSMPVFILGMVLSLFLGFTIAKIFQFYHNKIGFIIKNIPNYKLEIFTLALIQYISANYWGELKGQSYSIIQYNLFLSIVVFLFLYPFLDFIFGLFYKLLKLFTSIFLPNLNIWYALFIILSIWLFATKDSNLVYLLIGFNVLGIAYKVDKIKEEEFKLKMTGYLLSLSFVSIYVYVLFQLESNLLFAYSLSCLLTILNFEKLDFPYTTELFRLIFIIFGLLAIFRTSPALQEYLLPAKLLLFDIFFLLSFSILFKIKFALLSHFLTLFAFLFYISNSKELGFKNLTLLFLANIIISFLLHKVFSKEKHKDSA
jgi:hypothetical protein